MTSTLSFFEAKRIRPSLFLGLAPINAQLLQDTISLILVKKDIDYIYNALLYNATEVYNILNQ